MKQKNGFVISTTLYSIFGIMLLSVFYILYLLSNNRYVLTSSIDDIKESLFSKTKKVYLELGYYGDLPTTYNGNDISTDVKLEKLINNELKKQNINKEVEIISINQDYTETVTTEGEVVDMEHVLSASTPYTQIYDSTQDIDLYFTYNQSRTCDNSENKVMYTENISGSLYTYLGIINNKLIFSKGSMEEIVDNLYVKEGTTIKKDKSITSQNDPVFQIIEYDLNTRNFNITGTYKVKDLVYSTTLTYEEYEFGKYVFDSRYGLIPNYVKLGGETKITFENGIRLQLFWGNPTSDSNNRLLCFQPIISRTFQHYKDGNSNNGGISGKFVGGNCANINYTTTTGAWWDKNGNGKTGGLDQGDSYDYSYPIEYNSSIINKYMEEKFFNQKINSKNTYSDYYRGSLTVPKGDFCSKKDEFYSLKKGNLQGYVYTIRRKSPYYEKNHVNIEEYWNDPLSVDTSYYIVWYIPKGTIYHHVDWDIKGKNSIYDENYYIGYANTGDIELEHITINDNSKLKEYDNSLFIDISNKASSSITDNVSNYKTTTDDLIDEIINLIK